MAIQNGRNEELVSRLNPRELMGYEDGLEVKKVLLSKFQEKSKNQVESSGDSVMNYQASASRHLARFSTSYLSSLRLFEDVLARYLHLVGSATAVVRSENEVEERLKALLTAERNYVDKVLPAELREACKDFEDIENLRISSAV